MKKYLLISLLLATTPVFAQPSDNIENGYRKVDQGTVL